MLITVKKNICVTLIILSTLFIFSCTETTDIGKQENADQIQADLEKIALLETKQVKPDLPNMDFEGQVYNVLGRTNSTHIQFTNFEIDAEAITGDIVNDAVYNRNLKLEEKYNVIIEHTLVEDPASELQKLVAAGDDVHDLAFITPSKIAPMAVTGTFYDLNSSMYLDFEKPWWNQEVNEALSVNNKLYFTTSDFNMMDKNRTMILLFNKSMVESYNLGDFYNLVYDNKWTVDKMIELCIDVSIDFDGDGVMGLEDQWGFGMDDYNSFHTLLGGCDTPIVKKDSDDYPVLSINNEFTIMAIEKVMKLTNDKTMSFYCPEFQNKVSYDYWDTSSNLFIEGRILFISSFTHGLKTVAQSTITDDYGVLPFPKYTETQENYITTPNYVNAALFAIPVTVNDVEFSTFMLEAISAESKYEVLPYYYEVSAKTKYTYDEESAQMLDIIFNGIRYDLGCIYNWGGIYNLLAVTIAKSSTNNFVSEYQAIETKIITEMENTIESFKQIF